MLARDLYSSSHLTKKQREIRDLVLNDLEAFIKLVSPHMEIADCHRDMIKFLTNEEASTHQLILYPRYHSKSTIIGYYCGWRIVRDPLITILYASATATLAEAAVGLIKNIIDNDAIRKYFPELLGREEGKRELWRKNEIAVDHPIRKELKIRDATIFATGAGKNITGLHFDMIILDDIVAPTTELDPLSSVGRENARRWVSFATSILAPDGEIKVVGTRYHSEDIYNSFITMAEPIFDDDGNIVGEEPIYEVLERKVETNGEFLWPRKKGKDGKWYGFDEKILAKTKAQYLDTQQFYAQYYNTISDPENQIITRDMFNYYDKEALNFFAGRWRITSRELMIYAAVDLAVSVRKEADYTAIVVVGLDDLGYRYILDIARIKTNRISEISDNIFYLFNKWRFVKMRAEVNAQQGAIVTQLQDFLRQKNAIFSWDKKANLKNKYERIISILEPLYSQKIIFHYKGGNCEILEDELLNLKSTHDDIADALASCCEMIQWIPRMRNNKKVTNISIHPRWGGVV